MVSRPGVCCALDPLPSASRQGRSVHRHCLLPAGHEGFHETYDHDGDLAHCWQWQETVAVPDDGRLFDCG